MYLFGILDHAAQHLILWTKGKPVPAFEHQQHVTFLNGGRAVRHDQDRFALFFHFPDRGVERHAALVIQVGVRLVEDQNDRVAIQGARQSDALNLAT